MAKTQLLTSLLGQKECSRLLGVSVETLGRWRKSGKGPVYIMVGSLVKYRQSEVEWWLEQNTVVLQKPVEERKNGTR